MKVFAFRFDIDTVRCLSEGVPKLIDLAEKLNARFTFFLTVGRSVSVQNFICRKLKNHEKTKLIATSLSARQKLGLAGYVKTAILNPLIGPSYPAIVDRLAKSQELGLHGGKNHDLWHHTVSSWTKEMLTCEIEWALDWLNTREIRVSGFSCPGWSSHRDLPEVLEKFRFSYRADQHGPDKKWFLREGNLINLATNLTGEPGGVAYLEHQRALGKTDQEIIQDFSSRLDRAGDYAVVYDHPYFAGIREIPMIEKMINLARVKGFEVMSLNQITKACWDQGLQ